MIAYPITLTPDDNGTLLITSLDFPELASFGDTVEDALFRAQGALLRRSKLVYMIASRSRDLRRASTW